MKITDDEIKKAFEQIAIPEPSKSAKDKAMQSAMDAFVKKNVLAEKNSKGISGFLRHMGKSLLKMITLKGVPIMTQRQFATAGIVVIALGLMSLDRSRKFHPSRFINGKDFILATDRLVNMVQ